MKNLIFIILLTLPIVSYCQDRKTNKKEEFLQFQSYSIGLTPSTLFNDKMRIQISQDIGLSPYLNVKTEYAYIFDDRIENEHYYEPFGGLFKEVNALDAKGHHVIVGLEYLVLRRARFGLSIGIDGIYRYTESNMYINHLESISIFSENIWKEDLYYSTTNQFGGELTFGAHFKLTERIRIETGIGAGVTTKNILQEGYFDEAPFIEGSTIPTLSWNFNVSYALKTRMSKSPR